MQKLALLIILSASWSLLLAQPALNIDNFHMNIGERYAIHQIDYQTPSEAGADLLWDFSSSLLTPVDTFDIVDPSTSLFGSNFPLADVAMKAAYDVHVYYSQGDSGVYTLGNASTTSWTPFSDPKMQYMLPATMNSSASDYYYKLTDNGSGTQTISEGTTNLTADAYGTLQLPFGTFNDVLRFVRTEDNILVSIAEEDTTYSPITLIQHFFLTQESGWALLELNETILDGQSYFGAFAYEPLIVITEVDDLSSNSPQANFYPNPVEQVLNIDFENETKESWELQIIDSNGKEVLQSRMLDEMKNLFDLSSLSSGTYVVELISENGARIRKTIIVR